MKGGTTRSMKAGAMKTGALKKPSVPLPSHGTKTDRTPSGVRVHGHGAGHGRARVTVTNGSALGRMGERHDAESFAGNAEPTMVDVLNEPIVHTMMRRDGVEMESLQHLLHEAETVLLRRHDDADERSDIAS